MAMTEHNGLMIYQDAGGDKYILYPITKAALVDGLDDLLDGKSNTGHTHTAEDVGARPNTWLPTPAEIGAAPTNHSHGDAVAVIEQITNSGTWTAPADIEGGLVEVLVFGAGGGGTLPGTGAGGGGGGGGYFTYAKVEATPGQSFTCVIGAGGAVGASAGAAGSNGGASSFGNITANGGGGGQILNGGDGGSGGGAGAKGRGGNAGQTGGGGGNGANGVGYDGGNGGEYGGSGGGANSTPSEGEDGKPFVVPSWVLLFGNYIQNPSGGSRSAVASGGGGGPFAPGGKGNGGSGGGGGLLGKGGDGLLRYGGGGGGLGDGGYPIESSGSYHASAAGYGAGGAGCSGGNGGNGIILIFYTKKGA